MMNTWLKTVFLGCLVAVLIQCSPADTLQVPLDSPTPAINDLNEQATQVPTTSDQTKVMKDTQTPPPTSPPVDPGLQSLIDQAREDLSQRLSISTDQISVVKAKSVVWPDASLGCPQPGMKYKQVPEDGAQIILQVEGVNYDYHAGGSRGVFLCEQVSKDPNPPPRIDIFNLTPAPEYKNSLPPTTPDQGIPPGEDQ